MSGQRAAFIALQERFPVRAVQFFHPCFVNIRGKLCIQFVIVIDISFPHGFFGLAFIFAEHLIRIADEFCFGAERFAFQSHSADWLKA